MPVARQPEVFVHPLEPEQAQRLVRLTRRSTDRVRLRRAGIVLASVQGRNVTQIAEMFAASPGYVREVIHTFNDKGFAALDPKWSGGRPRKFGPVARELICRIARTAPSALGQPFTTWSLSKLVAYLAAHKRLVVSAETVRRVLREAGISWQRMKTWKASRDPDFTAKMARILQLYDTPPPNGRVLCVDEFGPLSLQPRPGRSSRPPAPNTHPTPRRCSRSTGGSRCPWPDPKSAPSGHSWRRRAGAGRPPAPHTLPIPSWCGRSAG
jgi:transposase